MKTENTLRTARNSLLCFFMALAAGFLVACGGGGGGGGVTVPSSPNVPTTSLATVNFSTYLFDTAAEGVEYSGPTGNGVTGEGGVFNASEGVFEFSIGATDLGRVSLNSDWANNEVTPSDFIGVNEAQAITIARIMQGLDSGNDLNDGISISQGAREHPEDLSALLDAMGTVQISNVVIGAESYTIPSVADAMSHLTATRKCLFSGGYVGDFEGASADGATRTSGQSYYAVEPFVNRVRTFTGADGNAEFRSFDETFTVGVTGSEIILSPGNELSFITPRLVAGVWQSANASGTENLTLAADTGNPGATRRIVGVETTGTGATLVGMYVLDYFEEATVFRGRYYDAAGVVSSVPLSLTIANGVSWPADNGMTVTLTLSGTRGEGNTTIAMEIVRVDENYGSFGGVDSELSGTWCDIGGAVGSTVPLTLSIEVTVTWSEVPGATVYKLYRSTASDGTVQIGGDIPSTVTLYVDRPSAGPEYSYQLEACNSAGCSERSSDPDPAGSGGGDGNGNGNGGGDDGQCRVGQMLMIGESCEWNGHTFSAESGGLAIAGPRISSAPLLTRRFVQQIGSDTLEATRDGTTWTITRADGAPDDGNGGDGNGGDGNGGDGNGNGNGNGGGGGGGAPLADPCFLGQTLRPGDSCSFIEHTISVSSASGGLSEISLDPPPEIGTGTFTRDPRGLDVTYTLTNRTTGARVGEVIIRNLGDDNDWIIRTLTTF